METAVERREGRRGMTAQQVLDIVRQGAETYPDEKYEKANAKWKRVLSWVSCAPVVVLVAIMLGSQNIPGFYKLFRSDAAAVAIVVLAVLAFVGFVVVCLIAFPMNRSARKLRSRLDERVAAVEPREGRPAGGEGFPQMTFGRFSSFLRENADPVRPVELVFACSPELRLGGAVNVVLPDRTDPVLPMLPEGDAYNMDLDGARESGAPLSVDALCSCLDMHAAQYGSDGALELLALDTDGAFCTTVDARWDIYPLGGNAFVIGGFVASEKEILLLTRQVGSAAGRDVANMVKAKRAQRPL